jgi:hypothetical protein
MENGNRFEEAVLVRLGMTREELDEEIMRTLATTTWEFDRLAKAERPAIRRMEKRMKSPEQIIADGIATDQEGGFNVA